MMPNSSLTVWYNTKCPVCDAGIDWQRNRLLAAVRAGTIVFKDINEQPDALASYGTGIDDIRRRLHATDEAGRLIVARMSPSRCGASRRARAGSQRCSAAA